MIENLVGALDSLTRLLLVIVILRLTKRFDTLTSMLKSAADFPEKVGELDPYRCKYPRIS